MNNFEEEKNIDNYISNTESEDILPTINYHF